MIATALLLAASWALVSVRASAQAVDSELPTPLRLEHVLARARGAHPEIEAFVHRAEAGEQRAVVVGTPQDPVVFAAADHVPLTMMGIDFNVGVEFTAPLGRVLRNRRRAARASARGQRHEVAQAELDVELDAAMAYFQLAYARALDGMLASQQALVDQLLAGTLARYATGLGSQADVLRVQAEVARIRAFRSTVEGMLVSSEGMLNASIARDPGSAIPPLALPRVTLPASLDDALDEAVSARPELRAQAAYVDSATAEIAVMRGMYRPMMMASLGGAYTMQDGPGLMGMIGFSIPVFRDRLRASVMEARAMRSMAESDLAAMRLMVQAEVAQAFGEFRAADARARALHDDVIPLARAAVDAMLAEYASGRVPLVSSIEAARALFAAEVEALAADLEVGMVSSRVARALGRSGVVAP